MDRLIDTIPMPASESVRLPSSTRIAHVHLRVSNLEKALGFYQDLLGLSSIASDGSTAGLSSSPTSKPLLLLTEDRYAKPRPPGAPGLFHLAIVFPRRRDLAATFKRLLEGRWLLQGFADHGVSEALYMADPDGNGVEVYTDRPRQEWPYRNGQLQMVTEPLDLENLLNEIEGDHEIPTSGDRAATLGHVHLQVSDLKEAELFYHHILGFDITQRNFPGALFLSSGGYHHHIGLNTWHSRGASPAPEGATGLISFALNLGDADAVKSIAARAQVTSYWKATSNGGLVICDRDNIRVEINSH